MKMGKRLSCSMGSSLVLSDLNGPALSHSGRMKYPRMGNGPYNPPKTKIQKIEVIFMYHFNVCL